MSSEFEVEEEPKDRTKWWWLGVIVLLGIMCAVLYVVNRRDYDVTRVRAKHILVKCDQGDPVDRARALELIADLRKRIENGESFSQLAEDFSDDAYSAARGGDLGYYPKGTFEGDFERYVWKALIGELSDVMQTTHGFHLVVVIDRSISKADQYEIELERKAVEAQQAGDSGTETAPEQ